MPTKKPEYEEDEKPGGAGSGRPAAQAGTVAALSAPQLTLLQLTPMLVNLRFFNIMRGQVLDGYLHDIGCGLCTIMSPRMFRAL